MNQGAGRVHWALYKDAACSNSGFVLNGSLSIGQVLPLEPHAESNSTDSSLNPTGIHLAPVLQRRLLTQYRANNGHSDFSSTKISNNVVPVVVEDLALGCRAAKMGLDSKASLYCKFELKGSVHEAEDVINTDWFSMKITRASEYRVRGNEAFKLADYRTAVRLYNRAVTLLEPPDSVMNSRKIQYSEDESEQVNPIAVACYANLATSYLKMKGSRDIDRCIAMASRALRLDSAHVKARYRRGLAYVLSKEFDLAVADLKKLCELEPDGKLFRYALTRAQAAKVQLQKKQQAAYANLYSE